MIQCEESFFASFASIGIYTYIYLATMKIAQCIRQPRLSFQRNATAVHQLTFRFGSEIVALLKLAGICDEHHPPHNVPT